MSHEPAIRMLQQAISISQSNLNLHGRVLPWPTYVEETKQHQASLQASLQLLEADNNGHADEESV